MEDLFGGECNMFNPAAARSCCDTDFVGSPAGIGVANIADSKVQTASLTDDDQQHFSVGGYLNVFSSPTS